MRGSFITFVFVIKKKTVWCQRIDEDMVKKIITLFILPTLENTVVVWNPHLKKHIEKIEKVQRVAMRWVPGVRDLNYEERLRKLQLSTLTERRDREDI